MHGSVSAREPVRVGEYNGWALTTVLVVERVSTKSTYSESQPAFLLGFLESGLFFVSSDTFNIFGTIRVIGLVVRDN
jgi:hypothetical protein